MVIPASVVIPAHGRPRALARCLDALAGQSLARDRFEVVVVDDGSPEPLADRVAESARDLRLSVLRQPNRGPAAARNRGAAAARGRVLAFTDDDCRPEPGWLAALLAAVEGDPDAVVGGATVNALPGNPYATASQLLVDHLYADHARGADPTPFFTSNNLALDRGAFHRLGGFDETFPRAAAEDRDFCDRAAAAGLALRFAPEARVLHAHAMGLAGYLRQHYAYGRGARRFHRRRAERGRTFPRPRASFYLGLLTAPWRWEPGVGGGGASGAEAGEGTTPPRLLLALLLALSQAANTAGFLRQALAPGRQAPP